MTDFQPYNPLDKKNLGNSVAEAMLQQAIYPLGALSEFQGAGVYAIYYTGTFPAYERLSFSNQGKQFASPIYVGKAVPSGARKGNYDEASPTKALYKRLCEHASSIVMSSNLDIRDFYCRFLVVDDIWIPLGESLLIAKFSPIWNKLIDGFGNHDPGSGRYNQLRSKWDTLHPGRTWAEKCRKRDDSPESIAEEIRAYLMTC